MANQHTKKKATPHKLAVKSSTAPTHGLHVGIHTRMLSTDQVKLLERAGVNSCTQKAIDQKLPHFTLLPGDNFTPILIQQWIALAYNNGTSEEKIIDAKALLKRIEQWRTDHPTACKIPS